MLNAWGRSLERFLLPNACLVCHRLVGPADPDGLVCGVCRSRMAGVVGGCERCQHPVPPVGPCRFCVAWPSTLQWVRSAVWLGVEARVLVHELKYGAAPRLAGAMAAGIAARVAVPGAAWLVPIPLGPRRRARRRYNQAEMVARRLAERWGCPVRPTCLHRPTDGPSQTALTPERRLANVAGAFSAVGPPPSRVGSPPLVILVDDVLTTGATVTAAAAALGSAGWPAVAAVTFARTMPYDVRVARHMSATVPATPQSLLSRIHRGRAWLFG